MRSHVPSRSFPLAAVLLAPVMLAGCAHDRAAEYRTSAKDPAVASWQSVTRVAEHKPSPKPAPKTVAPKTVEKTPPRVAARPANPLICPDGSDCLAELKNLVNGADRSWVGQPEPPQKFANGTRLFAYRALRPKLSCRELNLALTEIDVAARLALNPGSTLNADRAEKIALLAADVTQELSDEQQGRCGSSHSRTSTANTDAYGSTQSLR